MEDSRNENGMDAGNGMEWNGMEWITEWHGMEEMDPEGMMDHGPESTDNTYQG